MNRRLRRNSISGQFAPRLVEMLRSPAFSVLSLSARRLLDRLEIELAEHGGKENGRLIVTYDDLVRFGIHRQAIYPAIRECEALGFVEVTERGVAGTAEFRRPNRFRLTYRPTDHAQGDGTHEWRSVLTLEEATELAKAARSDVPPKKGMRYGGRQKSVRKPYRSAEIRSTETNTTGLDTETNTTLNISGVAAAQAREARPLQGAEASGTADRDDLLLDRLAKRFGSRGWDLLMELPGAHLDDLVQLERVNKLTQLDILKARMTLKNNVRFD